MFIEKLSDERCYEIFESILLAAFNNATMAREYVKNGKLVRLGNVLVKLQILEKNAKGFFEYKNIAHFTDLDAQVGNFSSINPYQVNRTFRKEMYKDFGQSFYDEYDKLHRKIITDKFNREIAAHEEIMADMTRPKEIENQM